MLQTRFNRSFDLGLLALKAVPRCGGQMWNLKCLVIYVYGYFNIILSKSQEKRFTAENAEDAEFIKFNHEEHEERLKNKFIVRRNFATKRHPPSFLKNYGEAGKREFWIFWTQVLKFAGFVRVATGSILVYAYILMYYTKNRGFENGGFEVESFFRQDNRISKRPKTNN